MLPVGGHKGFGLSFMVDVLTACLSGATPSPWVEGGEYESEGVGHFFLALRVEGARDLEAYRVSADKLVEAVHRAQRADGVEPFLVPGEREARVAIGRREGIPFDDATLVELESLGAEFGVGFPSGPTGGSR
jgi:LDH2 family malate/lactate/ureidoglycolate dehydrogenase